MLHMKKTLILSIMLLVAASGLKAQSPYKNGIGGSVGYTIVTASVSADYKRFITDNMAIQTDIIGKFCLTPGQVAGDTTHFGYYMLTHGLSGYVYYQKADAKVSLIAGGGLDIGYANTQEMGFIIAAIIKGLFNQDNTVTDKRGPKIGINSIVGFEVRKNHFGFQFDIRPGYGLAFLNEYENRTVTDGEGNPILDSNGNEVKKTEKIGKYGNVSYFDYSVNLMFRYYF